MNLFKRNKCQAKGCKENYTPLGFCPNGHYHAHVEFNDASK